jgi:hypothetical protein
MLKSALREELEREDAVERAYLARVAYHDSETPAVALCLRSKGPNDRQLVDRLAARFARLFDTEAHFDIIFLSAEQETEIQRVCRPFCCDR